MLVIDGLTDFAIEYEIPSYSTDIAAAWEVLEALIARGWCPDVIYGADADGPYWGCRLDSADEDEGERIIVRTADAAPLAICRAALAALGIKP